MVDSYPTHPPSVPPVGSYRLDPERSTVRADVKAMFGLITVHATFPLRAGEVHVSEELTGWSVQASIDSAGFASGNAKRDRDVASAALLDAAAYPEITFASEEIRQEGDGWAMRGVVTAHGTTDNVEVRVDQARFEDGVARFHATARLDRQSFGITKKKGMVGRNVELMIEAVGVSI